MFSIKSYVYGHMRLFLSVYSRLTHVESYSSLFSVMESNWSSPPQYNSGARVPVIFSSGTPAPNSFAFIAVDKKSITGLKVFKAITF